MRRAVLDELIRCLKEKHGDAYSPWGTSTDEIEGTGFEIAGLPVFFSVLSFGDIPEDMLDVQIDSDVTIPEELGYDRYMIFGLYSVQELVALVEEYRKPIDQWPDGNISMK
jgi:hypothetical protein